MRFRPALPLLLLAPAIVAPAQVSISIGLPHLNIGINVPVMPDLLAVPGSPVYYAPRMDANYFFYDGMYWVFRDDNWYASSWYNGPWAAVHPEALPDYLLRIPVRYYHRPPAYFRGWRGEERPRWEEHWGQDWSRRRTGWERSERPAPPPARLPEYQRTYQGRTYPGVDRQHQIHTENYHYQPQERVVREHYEQRAEHDRGRGNEEHRNH